MIQNPNGSGYGQPNPQPGGYGQPNPGMNPQNGYGQPNPNTNPNPGPQTGIQAPRAPMVAPGGHGPHGGVPPA